MYYTNNGPFNRNIVVKHALESFHYKDDKKPSEENTDNKENNNNGRE